ncbi:MAG TPA: HDOD domain-containing protein [Polyangiaceae bacterium LLY-WYZ-14_1]|nr:HDOD domain-containing protein [Polyangiaceae bacterium LLY-WYZ-14_1]
MGPPTIAGPIVHRSPWEVDRHDPRYGHGQHAIDSAEAAEALLLHESPLEGLRRVFSSPDYHPPPLPSVALRVHELTKRPDVPMGEVVGLIERDAMLAAEVLRLAQSPFYATKVPPQSLDDVAARLGLNTLRNLVWEVAAGRVFKVPAYQPAMENLRAHSVAVARLSRLVSSYTAVNAEQAFLCGLLHDVGWVACLLALAEGARSRGAAPPALADVVDEVGTIHGEAGATVARLWSLPGDLGLVLEHHHDPRIQGFVHPLSAVVAIANDLAVERGAGLDLSLQDGPRDLVEAPVLGLARDALDLDDGKLAAIVDQAA